MDIDALISARNPWVTELVIGGRRYGGTYRASVDDRVWGFIRRLRSEGLTAPRVLECGCLEGGHTVVMATELADASIMATDVRRENLERARLHADLMGISNISFCEADLERAGPAFEARYDAVFCVGLLYHLRDPASFLCRCALSSPRLWLWTVVCAEDESTLIEGAIRGRIHAEPTAHVLSAIREQSIFPTLGSLCNMLWAAGYVTIELIRKEITANGNGPAVLLYATQKSALAPS